MFLFLFVEYVREDGQKRPKHLGGLLCVCVIVHISVSNKFASVGISIVEFIAMFTRVRHWSQLYVK